MSVIKILNQISSDINRILYHITANSTIVFNAENVFIRLFFIFSTSTALVHRLVFGGSNWVDANTVKLFIDGNEVTPITVTGTFNLEATFDLLPSGTYSLELQTEEGNAVDRSVRCLHDQSIFSYCRFLIFFENDIFCDPVEYQISRI